MIMSWWWAGAVGAARKKIDDGPPAAPKFQSVGLIIGDTGLVGNSLAEILPLSDTPGGPWKVYGVSRGPKPPPSDPPSLGSFDHIACDVSDRGQTLDKLSPLAADVTHLFYLGEHQIWAAVDPYAKNEAFNCNNADVFKWKHMWSVLAEQFGVEFAGYDDGETRVTLEDAMKGKEVVWDEIARENELVHTKLEAVGNWEFVDMMLNMEDSYLSSMNKSKEHGFLGFRNSVSSFISWIDKTKAFKIVP